jgi:hypothetical protein
MLFIHETPLHFGIVITICVIALISVLLSIISVSRADGEQRWNRIFAMLFALFIFLMYLVFAVSLVILPASASVTELFPYYLVIWGFAGLHGFFIILFCLGVRFLGARKWLLFLVVLGGAVYVVLLFLLPTPFMVFTVSDGWLNYIAMPLLLVGYSIFLGIIYMFLVPLYVGIQMTKRLDAPGRRGLWVGWGGLFLSFFGAILISAVQYTVSFVLYAFVLVAVAWTLIVVGAINMGLLAKPKVE